MILPIWWSVRSPCRRRGCGRGCSCNRVIVASPSSARTTRGRFRAGGASSTSLPPGSLVLEHVLPAPASMQGGREALSRLALADEPGGFVLLVRLLLRQVPQSRHQHERSPCRTGWTTMRVRLIWRSVAPWLPPSPPSASMALRSAGSRPEACSHACQDKTHRGVWSCRFGSWNAARRDHLHRAMGA